jgi:hypothetical protein
MSAMANVYIEPRPKGRPEGSPIEDLWLKTTQITYLPPSKLSEKQSIGQKRTAIRRMSLASDT